MINLLDDEPQRFGERLGARLWGGRLYELAAGESSPNTGITARRSS